MAATGAARIIVFPLAGALLFPRARLPLHIFEPRYRAMVRDAMAGDRRIGMVQPRDDAEPPALFDIGCLGRISRCEESDDGRFNIVLTGLSRFRLLREHQGQTAYRQVDADCAAFADDGNEPPLDAIMRAALEGEARRYADRHGFSIDWDAVARVDDETLVNGIAQVAPFDVVAKQALLEAATMAERAGLIVQLMQFEAMASGRGGAANDDDGETLQ